MTVEINEDHPNENKEAIYSMPAITRQSTTITWHLAENQRLLREWGSLRWKNKKGRFHVCTEYWHGEPGGRLTRSKASYVIVLGEHI